MSLKSAVTRLTKPSIFSDLETIYSICGTNVSVESKIIPRSLTLSTRSKFAPSMLYAKDSGFLEHVNEIILHFSPFRLRPFSLDQLDKESKSFCNFKEFICNFKEEVFVAFKQQRHKSELTIQ